MKTQDIIGRKKILVVDDEIFNVSLITGILESGYQVIPAFNGKEALLKLRAEAPDLVLLDLMMPEMNGYEVCEKIKQQDTTRFTPVIIITSLSELEYKVKSIEAGADDFLTKPVNRIELITRVKALLKTKYFHDQLVASKEKTEAQAEFKTVMANLVPYMLASIPQDNKIEVLKEMSKRVEEVISKKYNYKSPIDLAMAAGISCGIMNRLGGCFSVEKTGEKTCTVKNITCPWGDDGKISPILCMLTRAVFTRVCMKVGGGLNIEISKTIAGGDDCCQVDIFMGEF